MKKTEENSTNYTYLKSASYFNHSMAHASLSYLKNTMKMTLKLAENFHKYKLFQFVVSQHHDLAPRQWCNYPPGNVVALLCYAKALAFLS